jgi:putative redox protein
MSRTVLVNGNGSAWNQRIVVGSHMLDSDEPLEFGGKDTGPDPYELILAGLGACTGMTLRMYAERKRWDLESVQVKLTYSKIHAEDCNECNPARNAIDQIERQIQLTGQLSEDQRRRLLEIANMCPVHRTLTSQIRVLTSLS